ncbi:P-loop NTPase fold protein [Mucilaginibacter angelicae]|uniref:P-loop NTPase fold protein n=1 Tax=Mucilaginibacter angelicae TaxID=869718 RepID=A0ABV6LFH2_9SPHI
MPGKITLIHDNLFSTYADAIVVPRSTVGSFGADFADGLLKYFDIDRSSNSPASKLGVLTLNEYPNKGRSNNQSPTFYLLEATTVDTSSLGDYEAIRSLGRQIAEFTQKYPRVADVATPLLGTGAGGLDHLKVYQLLAQEFTANAAPNCNLLVYIQDEKVYHTLIDSEGGTMSPVKKAGISPNETQYSVTGSAVSSQAVLTNIDRPEDDESDFFRNNSFYLAQSVWNGADYTESFFQAGIWEANIGELVEELQSVASASVVFLTSPVRNEKSRRLQIRGVGVVKNNNLDGRLVGVEWLIKDVNKSVRLTISDTGDFIVTGQDTARTILATIPGWEVILIPFLRDFKSKTPETGGSPVSLIAKLTSDTVSSDDYLGINKDVTAFAKIIASNNFSPPLAIGLFGKWGSGKSFFMSRLRDQVHYLGRSGQDFYCKGIVQIYFNSWSYLDANLWASIVSTIFDQLRQFIGGSTLSDQDEEDALNILNEEMGIVNEEMGAISEKKQQVQQQKDKLQQQRDDLEADLEKQLREVGKKSLDNVLASADKQFEISKQIKEAIDDNKSIQTTRKDIETVIPPVYLDHPGKAYEQARSIWTFIKVFFDRKRIGWNLLFLALLLSAILLIPYLTKNLAGWLKNYDLSLPSLQIIAASLAILLPGWKRFLTVYREWQPVVAAFWKIKTDYDKTVENALFVHQQKEKELELSIHTVQADINTLDRQLEQKEKILAELALRKKNVLEPEALYSFIERRCKSDDYRKHLGIISVIRKDFLTLSRLFLDNKYEKREEFLSKFEYPLDRIILYIDDLDRCPEERVVEVLEAVNLLMTFPLFVVVVGVDPRWVKNALLKRYAFQFSAAVMTNNGVMIEKIEASDYLEKIFQVPFHLKTAEDNEIKAMIQGLVGGARVSEPIPVDPDDIPAPVGNVSIPVSLSAKPTEDTPLPETDPHLVLTAREIYLMQQMSPILGNNPRVIKRFVNIYQVMRAHEGFYIKNNQGDDSYLPPLFNLALYTGRFKGLAHNFANYIQYEALSELTLSQYLEISVDADIDKIKISLKTELKGIKEVNLLNLQLSGFSQHERFISRFTFAEL